MSRSVGKKIEREVCDYFVKNGLEFVDANYSCKSGEIDLIMRDHGTLVFIEVRHRKQDDYGDGLESITRGKQNKIIRTAKQYLLENDLYDKIPCRFDVAATDGNSSSNVNWIRDAFWVKY